MSERRIAWAKYEDSFWVFFDLYKGILPDAVTLLFLSGMWSSYFRHLVWLPRASRTNASVVF
jgi:hypothetical protein